MTATLALVPVLSVLAGAAITYWLNVRARNRTRVEDIYHDAIAAVAVAAASKDFIADEIIAVIRQALARRARS